MGLKSGWKQIQKPLQKPDKNQLKNRPENSPGKGPFLQRSPPSTRREHGATLKNVEMKKNCERAARDHP